MSKAKDGNEWVDQALHFVGGALIVAGANLLGAEVGLLPGFFIGWSGGLIREVTEEGEISLGAFLKAAQGEFFLAFWALGGLVGGLTSYI